MLKLPTFAQVFHKYFEVIDRIDSWLTPRPPLLVTASLPLSTTTLPHTVVAMADAVEQVLPGQDVGVQLPGNAHFPAAMVKSIETHADNSTNVDIVGSAGNVVFFKPAEED